MKTSGVPNCARIPAVASENARGPSSRANASSCSEITARMAAASSAETSAAGDATATPSSRNAGRSDRTIIGYATLNLFHDRDRVDLVRIEGDHFLDRQHLVVRGLVRPHRILRATLQGIVRGFPLERTGAVMAGAYQPFHLHVLSRDVVDRGVTVFLETDRVLRVGNDLAPDFHLHPGARGLDPDAMARVLLPAGTAVGAHGFAFPHAVQSAQYATTRGGESTPSGKPSARAEHGVDPAREHARYIGPHLRVRAPRAHGHVKG